MRIMDNYGEFDLPEEKSEIEVIEDPVKAVMSCHELFKKTLPNTPTYLYDINKGSEFIYQMSLEALQGKEKLKFTEKQTKNILEFLNMQDEINNTKHHYILIDEMNSPFEYNGIFLSALQNTTNLDKLIIDFKYNYSIGYKLKKDKVVIIGKHTELHDLGRLGKGIIINEGKTYYFGSMCLSGVCINNGDAQGIGISSENGVLINNARTRHFLCQGYDYKGGIGINNGTIIGLQYGTENTILIKDKNSKEKQKLDDKLSEIEFTKTLDELPYEEQIRKVKEFDWQKFEKETTEIAEEIKEAYKKCA